MSNPDDRVKHLFERCNSAPILQWEVISSSPTKSNSSENKPLTPTSDHLQTPDEKQAFSFKRTKLRRHSSLTKGLLQRCRTTSDADERLGEAKVSPYTNFFIFYLSLDQYINFINKLYGKTQYSSIITGVIFIQAKFSFILLD